MSVCMRSLCCLFSFQAAKVPRLQVVCTAPALAMSGVKLVLRSSSSNNVEATPLNNLSSCSRLVNLPAYGIIEAITLSYLFRRDAQRIGQTDATDTCLLLRHQRGCSALQEANKQYLRAWVWGDSVLPTHVAVVSENLTHHSFTASGRT